MKLFWNRTNHKAGGLLGVGIHLGPRLSAPKDWASPAFLDLRGYCLPKNDQGQTSQCFPGGAPVLMEDLSWRPIRDVRVGQRVIAEDGQPHRVTDVFRRKWQGTLRRLHLTGDADPIECTQEHPILAIRRRKSGLKNREGARVPAWVPAGDLVEGDYVAHMGPRLGARTSDVYGFEADPEFWWCAGLFLAEGTYTSDASSDIGVGFCLHIDEVEYVYRVQALADKYGWVSRVDRDEAHHSCVVFVYSDVWRTWFGLNCGRGCSEKSLSPQVMWWPTERLSAILRGWVDGDGHERMGRVVGTTVSEKLSRQLRLVALKCGFVTSWNKRSPREDRQQAYDVTVRFAVGGPSTRGFWHDGLYYQPVRKNETVPQYYGASVYNLEVEDVHSYVVGCVVVHNCAAYAMACVIEVRNWKRTHIPIQIDPFPIYNEAKRIDADGQDGTTLSSVYEAAINLKLIPKDTKAVYFKSFEEYLFALHKYGVCLIGMEIDEGWSYADTKTGWIPEGKTPRGGHALAACWADALRGAGVQNSWGEWGVDGFGRVTISQYNRQIMGGLALEAPGDEC